MNTFEGVKEILVDILCVDSTEIKMESELHDDLGCDSLDLIEVIMKVENRFHITVNDDDLVGIVTVGDIVKYVDERLNKSIH